MDNAPPYSPTATGSEGYAHEDVLATLIRPRTTSYAGAQSELYYHERRSASEEQPDPNHALTVPPVFEPPPDYTAVDALAQTFMLNAPLICATRTNSIPRYQLMQEFSRSGRPKKLHIRRLMAFESRSYSLASANPAARRIPYDEDGTMYTITTFGMRGLRSSTLGGSIHCELGRNMRGKYAKIWHRTKNGRRDFLNPENEARLQKYGYRADEEWDKRLLFLVKRGLWEDAEGRIAATEDDGQDGAGGRRLEILEQVDGPKRDLLVACWMLKVWMGEGLRWEGDVMGW